VPGPQVALSGFKLTWRRLHHRRTAHPRAKRVLHHQIQQGRRFHHPYDRRMRNGHHAVDRSVQREGDRRQYDHTHFSRNRRYGVDVLSLSGAIAPTRPGRKCVALGDQLVSTGELVKRIWPRLSRYRPIHYHRARLAAAEIAYPDGRFSARGRPFEARAGNLDDRPRKPFGLGLRQPGAPCCPPPSG
jgi:hypothetical protein